MFVNLITCIACLTIVLCSVLQSRLNDITDNRTVFHQIPQVLKKMLNIRKTQAKAQIGH